MINSLPSAVTASFTRGHESADTANPTDSPQSPSLPRDTSPLLGNRPPRASTADRRPRSASPNSPPHTTVSGSQSQPQPLHSPPSPSAPQRYATLLAFKGDPTLAQAEEQGFSPAPVRRRTGHVMFSIDGGETPYGFGSVPPKGATPGQIMHHLSTKNTLPGIVRNDKASLQEILANPQVQGSSADEPQTVYKMDIPVSEEQYAKIKANINALPIDKPLEDVKYGFATVKDPSVANCVTFPGRIGIPLPNNNGRLGPFFDLLKRDGEEWTGGESK